MPPHGSAAAERVPLSAADTAPKRRSGRLLTATCEPLCADTSGKTRRAYPVETQPNDLSALSTRAASSIISTMDGATTARRCG